MALWNSKGFFTVTFMNFHKFVLFNREVSLFVFFHNSRIYPLYNLVEDSYLRICYFHNLIWPGLYKVTTSCKECAFPHLAPGKI